MSDLMLLGVLQMPIEMVMSDSLSTIQYIHRGHEAAQRIKADAAAIEAAHARIAALESQIAAAEEQEPVADRAEVIATVVKDLIETLMLWNGQASAGLDVRGLAGLRDEIELLYATPLQSEGLRKDAERYRWIRDVLRLDDIRWMNVANWNQANISADIWDLEIDTAIDAALAQQEKP